MMEKRPLLSFAAFIAVLYNAVDAVFTVYWIRHGVDESNPIMAAMLALGVEYFVAVKLTLVPALILFLWVYRRWTLARAGVYGSALLYFSLGILHTAMFLYLL